MDRIIEIRIEDMLDDGRAFGRSEGLAVFVSGGCKGPDGSCYAGAVPGDLVRARITKMKKSSAEAELLEIAEASDSRITASCLYFGKCGGCALQEMSYESQFAMKQRQVISKLERIAGIRDPKVNDVIASKSPVYYRNKAVFSIGPNGEVGFMRAGSHRVMDIEDCMLQSDAAMVCADALRAFLKLPEARGLAGGVIRQMTVRTAFSTGEVMVVLDAGRKDLPDIEVLIGMLDDAVYSLNAQDIDEEASGQTDVFYSLESVALVYGADPKKDKPGKCSIAAGKPTITEEVMRSDGNVLRYEISPQSFYQVNPEQMVKLYDKAAEYASLQGGETVLDLYCGAGTVGIWLLDELRQRDEKAVEQTGVIGIESVKPAVLDANRNSVINGIVNTRYIAGKAEEELPGMMGLAKLYKWNEVNERVEREPEIRIDRADVVVLDPPRAGCAEPLLAAAVQAAPDRIVYISCDPGTLARDIKYLTAHGYKFIEVTPVDQFPWTSHIEVVARIQKKKS